MPVPATFEGIPVLNNQRSWFFRYADKRGAGDIDALWRVFAAAQTLVEDDGPGTRDEFIEAYDAATQVWGVAWNLSTGLYWAAPWEFPTLDSQSRHYIQKRLGVPITTPAPQAPCDAATYLQLADDLRTRFAEEDYPVHSFPELSLASWQFKDATPAPQEDDARPDMSHDESGDELAAEVVQSPAPIVPYLLEDITRTGLGSGLEFEEIKLLPEVTQQFYIELPIQITVTGAYHDLATFVSGVAGLPRIVTLHDFELAPASKEGGSKLRMSILAKTYRYNDKGLQK